MVVLFLVLISLYPRVDPALTFRLFLGDFRGGTEQVTPTRACLPFVCAGRMVSKEQNEDLILKLLDPLGGHNEALSGLGGI